MHQIFFAALAAFLLQAAASLNAGTLDPLDVPAVVSKLLTRTQLSAVTRVGTRLVAVGIRGLVITSDDKGKTWQQRAVPVSSDLLAVHFPTPQNGWAVGHDGVILHTADGGTSWNKQLDGRATAKLLTAHFKKLSEGGDEAATRMLGDVELNYQNGAEQALLDVWFEDEKRGFAVGSFGTLLTTTDGGRNWQSWMERIDSEGLVHLNAVRGVGDGVYIASERGQVFRLDREKSRFVPSSTGYSGSFLTLAGSGNTVIASGLRGTAYRSVNAGQTWEKLDTKTVATLTGSGSLPNGRLMLVTQSGGVLISDDAGSSFSAFRAPVVSMLSGVVDVDGETAVVVGASGVQQVRLK